MTFREMLETAQAGFVSWAVVAVSAGFVWLVRRIFTNQAQIRELRAELKSREELRARDREDLLEVKRVVNDMRSDIQEIFRREK